MKNEALEIYKELIIKSTAEDGVKKSILAFLDTHGKDSENELENLLICLLGLISKTEVLQAKADAFDQIKDLHTKTNEDLQDLLSTALEIKESGLIPALDNSK